MGPFDFQLRTGTIFGGHAADRVGSLARELAFRRTLLVADPGIVEAGHAAAVQRSLEAVAIDVVSFSDFAENPDSAMVARGAAFASAARRPRFDRRRRRRQLARLRQGDQLPADQRRRDEPVPRLRESGHPLLPSIGIPTTAGTGSEAQSYAVIADAGTHMKMACGDPSAAFRVAILDPQLTASAPPAVSATAGIDAIAHAVETAVTTRRTPLSDTFSHQAWRLLADGSSA